MYQHANDLVLEEIVSILKGDSRVIRAVDPDQNLKAVREEIQRLFKEGRLDWSAVDAAAQLARTEFISTLERFW